MYINVLLSTQSDSTYTLLINDFKRGWPTLNGNNTLATFVGSGSTTPRPLPIQTPGIFYVNVYLNQLKKDTTDSSNAALLTLKAGYNAPPTDAGTTLQVNVLLLSFLSFVTFVYHHLF